MTSTLQFLFAAYIPLPPDGKISEGTPIWAVALYGVSGVLTLVLMYALIRKTRREKMRRKRPEEIR